MLLPLPIQSLDKDKHRMAVLNSLLLVESGSDIMETLPDVFREMTTARSHGEIKMESSLDRRRTDRPKSMSAWSDAVNEL